MDMIKNRTENWKTAKHFAPFFTNEVARARLARRLLDEPEDTPIGGVQIELFWKGMRDYLKCTKKSHEEVKDELKKLYSKCFGGLKKDVRAFGFEARKSWNYDPSQAPEKLFTNLRNTEIDIVVETPTTLFIGEAKGEMTFGADGALVLVHQLVRQYVTVKILVGLLHQDKRIVPFVVGGSDNVKQVQFMLKMGWLKKSHILCWNCIDRLAAG